MEGIPHPIPRTVEEVFQDFKGRRAGLIKALTTGTHSSSLFCSSSSSSLSSSSSYVCFYLFFFQVILFFLILHLGFNVADVEKFYQQCDPGGFEFFSLLFLEYFSLCETWDYDKFRFYYHISALQLMMYCVQCPV